MVKRVHVLLVVLSGLILCCACKESNQERITRLVNEWDGKELRFPSHSVFTSFGQDTIDFLDGKGGFKIVSYVDSAGCLSCKLQLPKWKEFMSATDSLSKKHSVSYLFYFHPNDLKELRYILKRDRFDYPVCIDVEDEFNQLNQFPSDMTFQTFLLNEQNKVVAIGNPIHNAKVKNLYHAILTGKKKDATSQVTTTVTVDKTTADFGKCDWKEPQSMTFELTNTGENRLVIYDVDTSCGCIQADFKKEPVKSGGTAKVKVTYTAEHPGFFNKTIRLHCNVDNSPIKLQVKGSAE